MSLLSQFMDLNFILSYPVSRTQTSAIPVLRDLLMIPSSGQHWVSLEQFNFVWLVKKFIVHSRDRSRVAEPCHFDADLTSYPFIFSRLGLLIL